MGRTRKTNITGATPSEIVDMLLVYKDAVSTPIESIYNILKQIDPKEKHFFVILVQNGQVMIQLAD